MVLEKLSESLKATLSRVARAMFVDERLIDDLVRDLQRALLHADVNVKLVFQLSKNIKERGLKEAPPAGLTQKEYLVKIVYEELVKLLGGEGRKIEITKRPFKILLVGLLGSGKTTTAAKLAKHFTKRGLKVATLGLDVHRPAAMDQLEQLCKQINIPYFIDKNEKNPIKIYKTFEKELNNYDLVLIDTAGRHALDADLIKELETLDQLIHPEERILVISADIGQAAQHQAASFHEACQITGVIATKMDGTAKAGGALSACSASQSAMLFLGVGEKADDLEPFNPQGFVSRLLGMGDLELLLEKAKEAVSEEQAQDLGKKLLKGDFNFLDLYEQMEAMTKMGPLSKIAELLPGFGNAKIPKEMLDVQQEKLKKWKHILQSCTKNELENPDLLDGSRVERIAKGSGTSVQEVRELLKQYRQSKKLMKMMKGNDPEKLMKKLQGKIPGLG